MKENDEWYNEVSEEKFLSMLLEDPIRMIDNVSCDFSTIDLLSKIDNILKESNILQDEVDVVKSKLENYIADNFDNLLSSNMTQERYTQRECYDFTTFKILKGFNTKDNKINSKIEEYLEDILENIDGRKYIEFMNICEDIDEVQKASGLSTIVSKTFNYMKDESVLWSVETVIKELMEKEGVSANEMAFMGEGFFSQVIKIGEYILKLGPDIETYNIPYDPRIIQPIVRKMIPFEYENLERDERLYIEVQNVVDAKWHEGMIDKEIDEQLYIIYSEMRDRGIDWRDVKKENVGRLIKPNKENYKFSGRELELETVDSAIGVSRDTEKKILQSGELVVIDIDYIYTEESTIPKRPGPRDSRHRDFEARYLKEKEAMVDSSDLKYDDIRQEYVISIESIEEATTGITLTDMNSTKSDIKKGLDKETQDISKDGE